MQEYSFIPEYAFIGILVVLTAAIIFTLLYCFYRSLKEPVKKQDHYYTIHSSEFHDDFYKAINEN